MTRAEIAAARKIRMDLKKVRYRWVYTFAVPLSVMMAIYFPRLDGAWHNWSLGLYLLFAALFLCISISAWRLKARLDRQQMNSPRG